MLYPALVNLADVFRMQKRDKEGESFLRQALNLAPNDAAVHHAFGLLLIRTGQKAEAMTALKHAWELQPDNPQYGYVYGIAFHSTGESKKAAAVLEKIHLRHPNDRQILMTLITMHRELGNTNTALQFAKNSKQFLNRVHPATSSQYGTVILTNKGVGSLFLPSRRSGIPFIKAPVAFSGSPFPNFQASLDRPLLH